MNWYRKFIYWLVKPKWVVNLDEGDLGIRIFGVNFYYYKWDTPFYYSQEKDRWRIMNKREFGEVIQSEKVLKNRRDK